MLVLTRFAYTSLLLTCALTLVLQGVVGVALPCDMSAPSGQSEMAAHAHHGGVDAPASPHAGHATHDNAGTADCCDGGYCSQGGCVTLLALPQAPSATAQKLSPAVARTAFPPILTRTLSTPYRPPALA